MEQYIPLHLPFMRQQFGVLAQTENSLGALVLILSVLIVFTLFGIGYWLLVQLLPVLQRNPKREVTTAAANPPRNKTKKKEEIIPAPGTAWSDEESLDWVKREFPDALLMDTQTLIREYQAGRRNFRNIYPAAVGPYETYLKWTVLDQADFSRAMLYRAPFDGSSLVDANFNGAYLEGASFRGAILRRANLSWADLTGADLSGADLSEANLSYALLNGADLSNARLAGALITPEQLQDTHSLKGATLPDGSKHQ